MQVEWKIWLTKDHQKVFGKGPKTLLLKIDALGSLRQAALSMNMSYSKAWRMITNLEQALGVPILEKKIGGADGGSSTLTEAARELIRKYEIFEKEAEKAILKAYFDVF